MRQDEIDFLRTFDGPPDEDYFERRNEALRSEPGQAEHAPPPADEWRLNDEQYDPWDPPMPLSPVADLPTFPTPALTDWVRDWVEAESVAVQVPVDMPAMFTLGMMATVAGGKVEVEPVDGWREPVNIFAAVAMDPGSRKSAVYRDAGAPILEHERLLNEETRPDITEQASIRRIAEQTLKRLEKAAASATDDLKRRELEEESKRAADALERSDVPSAPRLFTDDATPEGLAKLLHENQGRIAVLSAEAGIFSMMAGRYAGNGRPNIEVYLAGHAGDTIRVDRRGRAPEFVDRPALTVCVAVQPIVLRQAAQVAEFHGRGLFDRFLFALPRSNIGYRQIAPPPVSPAVRQRYHSSVRALAATFEHRTEPLILTLTDEALEALTDWRAELEPRRRADRDLGGVMKGWGSKLDGATLRIAGLLHLAATVETGADAPIDAPTVCAAIEIGRYLIPHARATYGHMGADTRLENARRVLDWLTRTRSVMVTKREIHSAMQSRFPKAADIDPVLRLLEEHGYLRTEPSTPGRQGGRPSQRYRVHPDLRNRTQGTEPPRGEGSVPFAGSVVHEPRRHADPPMYADEEEWLDIPPPEPDGRTSSTEPGRP